MPERKRFFSIDVFPKSVVFFCGSNFSSRNDVMLISLDNTKENLLTLVCMIIIIAFCFQVTCPASLGIYHQRRTLKDWMGRWRFDVINVKFMLSNDKVVGIISDRSLIRLNKLLCSSALKPKIEISKLY